MLINVLTSVNLLFIMNTDQYPNLYQNQYFQLDNKSERSH